MNSKRMVMTALMSVALALPAVAQPAQAQDAQTKIQQSVTKEIQSKKFSKVTANVDGTTVTLNGTVDKLADKLVLDKKVRKIHGVSAVNDQVSVAGTVDDAQLKQQLAKKLAYDRAGYWNVFDDVRLDVNDGVVTLSGTTRDYPARDSAIATAENMPGVKAVRNEINVAPASSFDDELRLRLLRAIYGNSVLSKYGMDPASPIRIAVTNGHVELDGTVMNKMDRQIAGMQANSVPGVFSVVNHLQVENDVAR